MNEEKWSITGVMVEEEKHYRMSRKFYNDIQTVCSSPSSADAEGRRRHGCSQSSSPLLFSK